MILSDRISDHTVGKRGHENGVKSMTTWTSVRLQEGEAEVRRPNTIVYCCISSSAEPTYYKQIQNKR